MSSGAPSGITERAGCGARWRSRVDELVCRWKTGGCVFPHQADRLPDRRARGSRVWAVSTEEGDFNAGVEGKQCGLIERCGRDAPLLQLSTLYFVF